MNMDAATFVDEEEYRRYLAALLAGDHRQCRAIFESILEGGIALRGIYQDLIQRSLYEVGALWEVGRASVATEHLATAITESLLSLIYPRLFNRPHLGKSAVVTCVANEYHQVGGKMVADVFEMSGWRGYFLGANTSIEDLLDFIRDKAPSVVAFSLTVYFNLETLLEAASAVRTAFPSIPILAGGQAFRLGGRSRIEEIPGVRCIASLDSLESWMKCPDGQ